MARSILEQRLWDFTQTLKTRLARMDVRLLPPGGQAGQVLALTKTSDQDFVYSWVDGTIGDELIQLQNQIDDDAEQIAGYVGDASQQVAAATALIAAIGQAPTSGLSFSAADRTAMALLATDRAVVLMEAGRKGTFVFDSSNLSAKVTADTAQGIYIAPSSDTSGASGAWVRQFDGPALSTWFGLSPSGTAAANRAAMDAALAVLFALRVTGVGFADGSIGLHTPTGIYQMDNSSSGISVNHALNITGDFTGGWSGGGTVFQFNNAVNPCFVSAVATPHSRPAFKGLLIVGVGAAVQNGTNHGIEAHNPINVENVTCFNLGGNAVDIYGQVGTGHGNANSSYCTNVFGSGVGWTLHNKGDDANACTHSNINGINNRFGAYFDETGLGNGLTGGSAESCGSVAGFATRCETNGHIYVVAFGQEGWCSTNAPTGAATSNQGWLYYYDGAASSTQPTWTTGQTWYFSAPWCVAPSMSSNHTSIDKVYIEGNCNPVVMVDSATIRVINNGGPPIWRSNGTTHGGSFGGAGDSLGLNGGLVVPGTLQARGASNILGANTGSAGPGFTYLDNVGNTSYLVARQWNSGVPTTLSQLTLHPSASNWNQISGTISFQVNSVTTATITSTALNLASGKVLQVNGTQVVSARQTGWTPGTGTANVGAFAAYAGGTRSATYVQAEAQATDDAAKAASQRILAIESALRTHGLIN